MVRMNFFEKNTPIEVKEEDGSVFVCQCGLSSNFPRCDGSHIKTKDEEADKIYQYVDGKPVVVGQIQKEGCGCCSDQAADHSESCCGKSDGSCHDDEDDHKCGCGCD